MAGTYSGGSQGGSHGRLDRVPERYLRERKGLAGRALT